ncbi:MAG: LysR family transcriptional regulator [Christensenellaceae bacterium]|nr:LysR family transcriptional regulator [Christensenellaceae bacterium]
MLDYRVYTFLTLYDEMNYRRTAEKLNMTQPGVTQHIHFLEKHYGVKLFEYDGRTLKRTKNAELLRRHFDSIRTELLALQQSFTTENLLHLKIGATKTIGEFVITPQIQAFLSEENHTLDLIVDNTETLLKMLENAELDFAIIEGVFDKHKYGYHLYKKESFIGICSANHPFAGKTVSLDALFHENIIVREKGSGTRRLLEQAICDRGFSLESFRSCSSVSNFSVICELIAEGHAITFAYEPIAHAHNNLATFSLEDIRIEGEFNYVYCNSHTAQQKIAQFLSRPFVVIS